MSSTRPALGKGVSALFPSTATSPGGVLQISVDLIDAMKEQPRQNFDQAALEDLAESIKESGVLQPLLVTKEGSRYRLIAGERRLRAAKIAGLAQVPVIVRQSTDEDAFLLALVENLQREDLNPIEQARAFKRLSDDYNMTQEAIAKRIGKQRSTVANSLRLLKLAPEVLAAVEEGRLAEGTARALLPLKQQRQLALLGPILEQNMTAREVERLAKIHKPKPKQAAPKESAMDAYFDQVRTQLEERTGLPTTLTHKGNRGRLTFAFRSLAELRNLVEQLEQALSK